MGREFVIGGSCKKSWDELSGDTRQRYCETCQTHVHAIEQYSAEEWDGIWRESNGHVCGYLCGASAPEPRSRREVLVGALITAISPLMAQNGRVRIRVTDASGGVVPGAETSLREVESKPTRTIRTNSMGEAVWTELTMGENRFTVSSPGFKSRPLTVLVRSADEVLIDTVLEVGSVGTTVEVEPVPVQSKPEPAKPAAPQPKPAKRRRWLIF